MSLTCQNCLTMQRARKKIDWQNPPVNFAAPPHACPVPCHYLHDVTLNDWLTVCLSSCQTKNPTAMCRPTLNFFFILQFLHFSLLVYLKISCQFIVFAFLSFPSTCLTKKKRDYHFRLLFFMIDVGIQMSKLILFTQRQNANITTI